MREQGSIEHMLSAYAAAVHAKDVDSFVALYSEDARVFDTWGRWSYDGLDEWRKSVTEWFGSLGNERVVVELKELETTETADLAVAHAFITFRGLSAEGEELRAMDNRLTWALRRAGDGAWKIVHEHTSAPASFESGNVILRR
jgi:uncharacterized protein (TIGR02246 family)